MNCKPGDLAIIIRGTYNSRFSCNCMIGKIVYIESFADNHPKFGHRWNVPEALTCIHFPGKKEGECCIPDTDVRPLPPDTDCMGHEHNKELETV